MITIEMNSQLQTWISPLKVRASMVAVWNGDTVVGERLAHYTVKNQAVIEADQWQQQIAGQWLALGGLLKYLWEHRQTILPLDGRIERRLRIHLPPGRVNLESFKRHGCEVEYLNAYKAGPGLTVASPGYEYKRRCEGMIEDFDCEVKDGIKFSFVVNGSIAEARTLLLDKGASNSELMGFKFIGQRILRILDGEQARRLDTFYNKIAPKRRRAISRRKRNDAE